MVNFPNLKGSRSDLAFHTRIFRNKFFGVADLGEIQRIKLFPDPRELCRFALALRAGER